MSDKIFVLSSRPGKVKNVHSLRFDENLTPFEKRQLPESKILFDKIWGEIQNEE